MTEEKKKVVVRFPPSPTGLFHVGNARTFLFNYIFAKQNNGKIVFRLEDTDKERSKEEYSQDIITNLKWLGIEPDFSTTVRQSERGGIYKKYLNKMIEEGKAYLSKEENVEEGQRPEVIRFKNPNKKIKFTDLVRGDIEFDTAELKDFIIAKSLEEPVYHLAVVIDDFEMGVTHVIRGDDGISNTPRQILIQEAIGAPRPVYAHLPMILAEDHSKLSKRKHGESVSVSYYRENGYLPEALINFLAFIGWNPGDEREIMSMDELIKEFDIKKIQKAGAVFNIEKLNWLNVEYLRAKKDEQFEKWLDFIPAYKEKISVWKKVLDILITDKRIVKLADVKSAWERGEVGYFFEAPSYDKNLLKWKDEKDIGQTKVHLEKIISLLEKIPEDSFTSQNIKEGIWPYTEDNGRGNVLWPLRTALTGLERSPEPFIIAEALGQEEVLKRLKTAVSLI